MDLSERIKRWREANAISKAELARRVGKSRAAACQWEQGDCAPSLDTIEQLAHVFGVTVAEFWGTPPRKKRSA